MKNKEKYFTITIMDVSIKYLCNVCLQTLLDYLNIYMQKIFIVKKNYVGMCVK